MLPATLTTVCSGVAVAAYARRAPPPGQSRALLRAGAARDGRLAGAGTTLGSLVRLGRNGSAAKMRRPQGSRPATVVVENRQNGKTPVGPVRLPHAKFVEEDILVGENVAEHIRITAVDSRGQPIASKRRILVIPGNPGVVGYYSDFCEALWREAGGEAEVTCLGLLGHSTRPGLYPPGAVWSLQNQEDHIATHVEQQSEQGPPLELVGHSIGAHLGLEALRRHPRKVLQVAGVYPYLTNNPESWEQAFLSKLVHMPRVVWLAAVLADLVGKLNPLLRRLVLLPLELGFAMDTAAAAITAVAMTSYDAVRNMCFLGRTELDALRAPPHWAVLVGFRARISMVFNLKNDYWAPLWLMREVKRRIPGLRTYVDFKQDHMFVCREGASKDLARMVVHVMLAPAGKGRKGRAARANVSP